MFHNCRVSEIKIPSRKAVCFLTYMYLCLCVCLFVHMQKLYFLILSELLGFDHEFLREMMNKQEENCVPKLSFLR